MTDNIEMHELAEKIKAAARDCGYIACGIAPASPFDIYHEALNRRIVEYPAAAGLYRPMKNRIDPRRKTPWVNAIVACVRRYGKYRLPAGPATHIGRNYLADRRIPDCPDHAMPGRMTRALKELGLRVKRGGVPDRLAGAMAGVVGIGRNGFAYHEEAGSWINLECWRVDAPLPVDRPKLESICPPDCHVCMKACRTGALCDAYMMRMDHCVAHLTYGAEHPIPNDLWQAMGPWIYGCDDCQTVCPLNQGKWIESDPAPWLEGISKLLTPESLAGMDSGTYQKSILPLFWYIPADQIDRWRANARRAAEYQRSVGATGIT